MNRIFLVAIALVGAAAIAIFAFSSRAGSGDAGEWPRYEASRFAALQDAGKAIVVDVYAPWCPTCRSQAPTLDKLRKDSAFRDVAFVRVDYDNDRAFLKAHKVPRQSTILVFKGRKEVARSIAETDPKRLTAVVSKAL